jgi:uncharacterized protein
LPFDLPKHAQLAFINEFHYDDFGIDTREFIEIAQTTSIDYTVILYNGSNGASYDTKTVPTSRSGPDSNCFYYSIYEYTILNGIQNGSPDGIALVHPDGTVVQFLSYEGTFTAVGGPADGMLSTSIGAATEAGTSPSSQSLQLVNGVWVGPIANTKGVANSGTMASACVPVTSPVVPPVIPPVTAPASSPM